MFYLTLGGGSVVFFVRLLVFWNSHQTPLRGTGMFTVGNGTKQGGILSPYLFTCYVRPPIIYVIYFAHRCSTMHIIQNIQLAKQNIILQ